MSAGAVVEELRFPTIGGEQPLSFYAPADEVRAAVLVCPALGLRAGYYGDFAKRLAGVGLAAATLDFPGHGDSPVRASRGADWGYPELVEHVHAAREAVQARVPGAPLVVVGHSIGGQVAMLAAGARPGAFAGVGLIASGTPYWRAFAGATGWGIRAGATVTAPLAGTLGYFPGESVRFGGREARTLMKQWAVLARTGDYRFDDWDGEALLGAVRGPLLAVRVEGDELAPEAAVEHVLAKLGPAEIERAVWSGLPAENVHNRWPRTPAPAVAYVETLVRRLA